VALYFILLVYSTLDALLHYFYFYFTITSKVGWGDHVRQLHELITGETSVFMEGRF